MSEESLQKQIDELDKKIGKRISLIENDGKTLPHRHDGVDNLKINAKDLIGFPTISVASAITAPTDSPINGTVRFLYDGTNYVQWIRVNNTWKYIFINSASDIWTNYFTLSTIVGWSSFSVGTRLIYYELIGNICFVSFYLAGTSNATTATFTLPYTAYNDPLNSLNFIYAIAVEDNGVWKTAPGYIRIPEDSIIAYCGIDMSGDGGFTASGAKAVIGSFNYVIK